MLHRDEDVIVIDKPQGLAVQGGTNTARHLDGMLDALTFDAAERPRLVHRLDKDTSGVLVLARNARAAAKLAQAFREKSMRKIYWAVVVECRKSVKAASTRNSPSCRANGRARRARRGGKARRDILQDRRSCR